MGNQLQTLSVSEKMIIVLLAELQQVNNQLKRMFEDKI